MRKHINQSWRSLFALPIVLCISVVISAAVNTSAQAHNNVVVIPMAGDDVPAELTPSTPVAKVDTSQSDYTIMANTVIDNITKLEWQRQDDDTTRTFDEAWDYCVDLDLDGHQDWRLPSVNEFTSIVDYGQANGPLIEEVAFPNTNPAFFWSAVNSAIDTSSAWIILFQTGNVALHDKSNNNFVRCVR